MATMSVNLELARTERTLRISRLKSIICDISGKQAELMATLGSGIAQQSDLLEKEQTHLTAQQSQLLGQQRELEKQQVELTKQQEQLVIHQRALMEHQVRLTAEIRQKHQEIQHIQARIQDMAAEIEKLVAIVKHEEEQDKAFGTPRKEGEQSRKVESST